MNDDEYRCECKELDDWSSFQDDYLGNPRACHCECNKACTIDEYLDIENCSCEKHLLSKLVLACEDQILLITKFTNKPSSNVCFEKNFSQYEIRLEKDLYFTAYNSY